MQAHLQKKQLLATPARPTHVPFVSGRQVQRPHHNCVVVRAQADGERMVLGSTTPQTELIQTVQLSLTCALVPGQRPQRHLCPCQLHAGCAMPETAHARLSTGTAWVSNSCRDHLHTQSLNSSCRVCPLCAATEDAELEQRLAALRRAKGATPGSEITLGKGKKKAAPSSSSSSSGKKQGVSAWGRMLGLQFVAPGRGACAPADLA